MLTTTELILYYKGERIFLKEWVDNKVNPEDITMDLTVTKGDGTTEKILEANK